MKVSIYQGKNHTDKKAAITIVIDVLRAFTVAHYAFLRGAKQIYLVSTKEEAFHMKKDNPDLLLVGEEHGVEITGFDLGNSPYQISQCELTDKTLVQKTTNGVQATLNCLASDHVFVTGFTNAKKTAEFIRKRLFDGNNEEVHIIASHPSGDDDYACAEYIKDILEGKTRVTSVNHVVERIKNSQVAKKFYETSNKEFLPEDIRFSTKELYSSFVMKVDKNCPIPKIERVQL
ncbi:2-phosphosulfolactate phosphatase [Oceanobacillus limi]|uniref:Probable 2-phosphosulfolactate phosphatase n=1 Tax=Oceanobacillus limi TaxID=930131 RepID=A0A1I0GAM5_9BACI|nr:2-phosphosulfolactate phosphatase [Oceanobacillus limi]SET68020.1 2-phosphosulfolactate phosphatase [Oceanobacillus limi]